MVLWTDRGFPSYGATVDLPADAVLVAELPTARTSVLAALLEAKAATATAPVGAADAAPDAEVLEALEALGYLD